MDIVGVYSFNNGKEVMGTEYPDELAEIFEVVQGVDAGEHKNKVSEEITSEGKVFYSPRELNKAIKALFVSKHWESDVRVPCDYPTEFYVNDYAPSGEIGRGAFREMDFIKNRVGIEVQFGKYSFMVYNVAAKMTIFNKLNLIDAGVEIVPVKEMAGQMSTGVSYFEQFLWDLQQRGVSDIDIPVLILGICPGDLSRKKSKDEN